MTHYSVMASFILYNDGTFGKIYFKNKNRDSVYIQNIR